MAHTDKRIAEIEAELVGLRADQASETAAIDAATPAGIPATWFPITYQRAPGDWIVIGWIDPAFEVTAFELGKIGKTPKVKAPKP